MNPIKLSLTDLEAVLAVRKHASFRLASLDLHLSQPSVSARIKHAEDVLGVKLFHRTTRHVSITDHGERLCSRAERTMADLGAILHEFKDEAQMRRGRVVVGAAPTIAGPLLSEFIQRFKTRWPGVEIILFDDLLGRELHRLTTGEVDFAITPSQPADARFDFEPVFKEEILLVAPLGHALLGKGTTSIKAVSKFPIISMTMQTAIWATQEDAFKAESLTFAPAFQTRSQLTIIPMVKCGMGVSFVPIHSFELFNMDSLGAARIGKKGLFREIAIATAHGRSLQPAAQMLLGEIRSGLQAKRYGSSKKTGGIL